MSEGVTVPDFMEPIVGWRFWLVNKDHHLTGWGNQSTREHVWPCYEPSVATHKGYYKCNGRAICNDFPNDFPSDVHFIQSGGCGHYAFKSIQGLFSKIQDMICYIHPILQPLILGQVNLWGTIAEHKNGYRAQFAYPKMFFGSIGVAVDAVAKNYGVPLEEDPTWKLDYQSRQSELSPFSLQSQLGSLWNCQCMVCQVRQTRQRQFDRQRQLDHYVRNLSQLRGGV